MAAATTTRRKTGFTAPMQRRMDALIQRSKRRELKAVELAELHRLVDRAEAASIEMLDSRVTQSRTRRIRRAA